SATGRYSTPKDRCRPPTHSAFGAASSSTGQTSRQSPVAIAMATLPTISPSETKRSLFLTQKPQISSAVPKAEETHARVSAVLGRGQQDPPDSQPQSERRICTRTSALTTVTTVLEAR